MILPPPPTSKILIIKQLQSVVIAPLVKNSVAVGKMLTFELTKELFLTNSLLTIEKLSVDFGEGNTPQTLRLGDNCQAKFATAGTKTLRFELLLSNGKKHTTYATLEVADNSQNRSGLVPPCFTRNVSSTYYNNGGAPYEYTNPIEFGALHLAAAQAEIGYYYASGKSCGGAGTLTKPVVLVDGFDVADVRKIEDIYSTELIYNGPNTNFGRDLRDAGYDVVIINFPTYYVGYAQGAPRYRDGGADYVERNGTALMVAINMLNSELPAGSTEKLTIVGTSMGGLIARYALARMEKFYENHNTGLFVSFDAPHNGANIPLGGQEFLRYWAGEGSGGAQASYTNKINSNAAKQMLLHHRNQPVGFPSTPQANWYRNTFKSAMQNNGLPGSNGYPMNLRKVAVANGSQTGTLTGFAGQMNLEMDLHIQMFNGNFMRVGGSKTYTTRSYGGSGVVSYAEKSRFSVWEGITNHSETQFSNGTPNSVSYDIAPGGMFNVYQVIRDEALAANPSFIGPFNSAAVMASFSMPNALHCFIPTKSALGFTGYNQDLGEALNNRSLVCSGETPFNAYYAPTANEGHAKLNQNSVDWLKRELGIASGGPNTNPSPYVMPFTVRIVKTSTGISCAGIAQTYTVVMPTSPSIGTVQTYVWSVGGNLQIVQGQNSPTISVVPTNNLGGVLSVEVYTNGICQSKGIISENTFVRADLPVVAKGNGFFTTCGSPGYPVPYINATSISISTVNGGAFQPITGQVYLPVGTHIVIASNICGLSMPRTINVVEIVDCKTVGEIPKQSEITVSPNPANTYLDVANILAGSEVKIYTKMGILVHSEKSENDKIRLDISKLNTDLYILEAVLPNNVRVRKQIVKE